MAVADDLQERERQAGNADDSYNPGQQHYRESVNNGEHDNIEGYDRSADGLDDYDEEVFGQPKSGEYVDTHGDKIRRNYNADEPENSRDAVKDAEESPVLPTTGSGKEKKKGFLNSKLKAGSKGYLSSGAVIGLILGAFGLSSVLLGPASLLVNLSSLLSNHTDLGKHLFVKTGNSYIASIFKGEGRNCETSKIKCKFTTVSEKRIKQWEARGIKVIYDPNPTKLTGHYKIRGLEYKGKRVTNLREYNALRYTNPEFHSLLKRFPVRAGYLNKKSSIGKSLAKFNKSLSDRFRSNKSKDKNDRRSENKAAANQRIGVEVDDNGNTRPGSVRDKKQSQNVSKAQDRLGKVGRAGGIFAATTLTGELACVAYNTIRAVQAATILLWNEKLISFALQFLQAGAQAKEAGVNGDFDWETAEFFGDWLTQPVTEKDVEEHPDTYTRDMIGKTMMDSKGLGAALNGDTASLKDYSAKYTGWSPVGDDVEGGIIGSDVVKAVQEKFGKENIKTICKSVRIASYAALGGCFIAPPASIIQCTIGFAVQQAVQRLFADDIANWVINLLQKPALEAIEKANLTSDLHGPPAGEALAAGSGVLASYMDRSSGFAVAGDDSQAYQAYNDMITDDDYLQGQIADAKYEASKNQFDLTNKYSFAGQFASKFASIPWNGTVLSVFANMTKAISGEMSLMGTASAVKDGMFQPIEVYNSRQQFDRTLDNCESPGMNEIEVPCMGESGRAVPYVLPTVQKCLDKEEVDSNTVCIEKAIDYLSSRTYDNGEKPYISPDTGEPSDMSDYSESKVDYKNPFLMYMRHCGNGREYPLGYTDEEVQKDENAWYVGLNCVAGKNHLGKGEKPDDEKLAWMSYYYNMCIGIYASEEDRDYCWQDQPVASVTPSECASNGDTRAIYTCALKYDNYRYLWGGGHNDHMPNAQQWISEFKSGAIPEWEPILDCSGLVRVAFVEAMGIEDVAYHAPEGYASSKYWEKIPLEEARQGDIVTSSGHVAIVEANDPGASTFKIFHASTSNGPKEDNILHSTQSYGDTLAAYRARKVVSV